MNSSKIFVIVFISSLFVGVLGRAEDHGHLRVKLTIWTVETDKNGSGMDFLASKPKFELIPAFKKNKALSFDDLVAVFTEPQYLIMQDVWAKENDVSISRKVSQSVSSQQTAEMKNPANDEVAFFLKPTVGADIYTVDLQFQSSKKKKEDSSVITVWDGQAVALSGPVSNSRSITYFVGVNIVDKRGRRIHSS